MMGFLQENTPVSELPLLISFEAKSLGTYSSIFVASPILKYFKVSYKTIEKEEEKIVP